MINLTRSNFIGPLILYILKDIKIFMIMQEEIAQCTGLWVAEGDNKSKFEITLTNNDENLIIFFHKIITSILNVQNKPRVYVYSPLKNIEVLLPIDVLHKHYIDERANKPYFIYRIADVKAVKKWYKIIEKIKREIKLYSFVLQGIFAGEGNIKFIKKFKSRVIRISQGEPNIFLEKILKQFNVKFRYSPRERAYVISGRANLEKLCQLNISNLHKEKDSKLKTMMNTYKQYHYTRGFLKDKLYNFLKSPYTSFQLAEIFKRSQTRITGELSNLKKQNKIKNFRVRSKTYWIRLDRNIIIISKRKQEFLDFLIIPRYTFEIANYLNINWKAAFRRLKELEKLNLVKFEDDLWHKIKTTEEVKII